jgi:hypothetical protein
MNDQKVADRALGLLVPKLAFVSETPLLPTESSEKFEEFSTTLGKGLNTKNIVEDLLAIDRRSGPGLRSHRRDAFARDQANPSPSRCRRRFNNHR